MKAVFERCCDAGAVHIQVAHAFDDAARWFVKVSAHAVGCYDEPGLGEWSLRDLLRHTRRSLSTVETYLDVALTDSGPYSWPTPLPSTRPRPMPSTTPRRRSSAIGSVARSAPVAGPGNSATGTRTPTPAQSGGKRSLKQALRGGPHRG